MAAIHVRRGRFPVVVLGAGQRALLPGCRLRAHLRASGGGAVLSGPWLLRATVVLPRSHPLVQDGIVAAARWLGALHCQWLQAQGVEGAAVYDGASVEHWACHAGRSAGEVLVGGRKIVGVAQAWRRASVTLSAGTLVAPAPWTLLCDALGAPDGDAADIAARTTTAEDCLRRPLAPAAAAELRALLEHAVAHGDRPPA